MSRKKKAVGAEPGLYRALKLLTDALTGEYVQPGEVIDLSSRTEGVIKAHLHQGRIEPMPGGQVAAHEEAPEEKEATHG